MRFSRFVVYIILGTGRRRSECMMNQCLGAVIDLVRFCNIEKMYVVLPQAAGLVYLSCVALC